MKHQHLARLLAGTVAATIAGGSLLGSIALATPAQAHNPAYNCTKTWIWDAEGAYMHCSGGQAGDQARIVIQCRRISGGGIATKYSGYIRNGSQNFYCAYGYEIVGLTGQIQYADGHTGSF